MVSGLDGSPYQVRNGHLVATNAALRSQMLDVIRDERRR